jgi:hypothetical protein
VKALQNKVEGPMIDILRLSDEEFLIAQTNNFDVSRSMHMGQISDASFAASG